jgi:hypothetical protein
MTASHITECNTYQASPEYISSQATERANRRATVALFSGIVALAIAGITAGALANSMIKHHPMAGAMLGGTANGGVQRLSLYVAPSWKKGPEGELHDAFSKTDFHVAVGQTLALTIDNRDQAIHSITAAAAGVNIIVLPGKHTYTLVVQKAGHFKWICVYVCDPFSMGHAGYMQGYITAS